MRPPRPIQAVGMEEEQVRVVRRRFHGREGPCLAFPLDEGRVDQRHVREHRDLGRDGAGLIGRETRHVARSGVFRDEERPSIDLQRERIGEVRFRGHGAVRLTEAAVRERGGGDLSLLGSPGKSFEEQADRRAGFDLMPERIGKEFTARRLHPYHALQAQGLPVRAHDPRDIGDRRRDHAAVPVLSIEAIGHLRSDEGAHGLPQEPDHRPVVRLTIDAALAARQRRGRRAASGQNGRTRAAQPRRAAEVHRVPRLHVRRRSGLERALPKYPAAIQFVAEHLQDAAHDRRPFGDFPEAGRLTAVFRRIAVMI